MITLYLLSKKGFSVLNHIIDSGKSDLIDAVVLAEDKQVANDYSKDIKELCISNNISVYPKDHLSNSKFIIAVSWRWMISNNASKIIVIHDSILPKYRGFSPLVNTLINGENEIGATALLASKEYDRGDIIAQEKINITYPINISNAIDIVSNLYLLLIDSIIEKVNSGIDLVGEHQKDSEATYSLWRDSEDYRIDWTQSSERIERFINAVGYPYLCATTFIRDAKFKILEAKTVEDVTIENRKCGKVIFMEDGIPTVVCGTGLLKILKILDQNGNDYLPLKSFRLRFK